MSCSRVFQTSIAPSSSPGIFSSLCSVQVQRRSLCSLSFLSSFLFCLRYALIVSRSPPSSRSPVFRESLFSFDLHAVLINERKARGSHSLYAFPQKKRKIANCTNTMDLRIQRRRRRRRGRDERMKNVCVKYARRT